MRCSIISEGLAGLPNRLFALAFFALLSGCATVGVERIENLPQSHKIVVLSLLNDKIEVKHTGTTVFNNWRQKAKIANWHINDDVESYIEQQLASAGRFSVVHGDTKRARAAAGEAGTDRWTGATRLKGGNEVLARLADAAGADSVLVVTPSKMEDIIFGTNQIIAGIGIYQRSFLGINRAVDYVLLRITLIDGETGEEIGHSIVNKWTDRDRRYWLEKGSTLSEQDQSATHRALSSLLVESLRTSMSNLKLI